MPTVYAQWKVGNRLRIMPTYQVVAEFDFDAQPGTSEISLKQGDVLTVLQDVSFTILRTFFSKF